MIKKNEKGITIVALVIIIIILIILAGVSITLGGDVIKSAKLQSINTNMLLIQAKAKVIFEESNFNKDETLLKGTKVSQITENQEVLKLISESIIEDVENSYVLSQEDLDEIGLYNIDIEDGYIVNYQTEEIIYVKGFKLKDTTYYKLSQTKDLNIK